MVKIVTGIDIRDRFKFLVSEALRYDIEGRKYIGAECKYHFEDMGIRNSLLNFRQYEMTHILENVIYNELRCRGYQNKDGRCLWCMYILHTFRTSAFSYGMVS